MRKHKFLTVLLGVFLSVLMTVAAFAQDVYVTKRGKKYHKEGSRFIKGKEVQKLTLEEAEELGYEPSSEFAKDVEEVEK